VATEHHAQGAGGLPHLGELTPDFWLKESSPHTAVEVGGGPRAAVREAVPPIGRRHRGPGASPPRGRAGDAVGTTAPCSRALSCLPPPSAPGGARRSSPAAGRSPGSGSPRPAPPAPRSPPAGSAPPQRLSRRPTRSTSRTASQAVRRTASIPSGCPFSSSPAGPPGRRPASSTRRLRCGRWPPTWGSRPESSCCRQSSTRASARRWAGLRSSSAARGPLQASSAFWSRLPPSGSRRPSSRGDSPQPAAGMNPASRRPPPL
jgi:hypothetical protein